MSLNKYMHPRNIYKNPPSFKLLAAKNTEFAKYCKIDLSGKVIFEFTNRDALVCLCKVLLKTDFGLDVNIPSDTLTPTVPLRLNYILWIEDIFAEYSTDMQLSGIDIGTGAACIFPLLISKKNGWKMLGTDINSRTVENAKQNIVRNNLEHLITVKQTPVSCYLIGCINEDETYDFCMCNPPFFSDEKELDMKSKSRTEQRNPPRNCQTGLMEEVISEGGEIQFVKNIINDSVVLRNKIKVYTTMLGHKSSVNELVKELKKHDILSMSKAQFFQGHTLRWGLAWSFCIPNLKNFLPSEEVQKPTKPVIWDVKSKYPIDECFEIVENVLTDLKIDHEMMNQSGNIRVWNICPFENTWIRQRSKRRAAKIKSLTEDVQNASNTNHNILTSSDTTVYDTSSDKISNLDNKFCTPNNDSFVGITDATGHSISVPNLITSCTVNCTVNSISIPNPVRSCITTNDLRNKPEPNNFEMEVEDTDTDLNNCLKRSCDNMEDINEFIRQKKIRRIESLIINNVSEQKIPLVEANIYVCGRANGSIQLQSHFVEGNKEAAHQILQILKNNLI